MDSLTYTYYDQTNRLNWVKDITPSSRYGNDAGDIPDIDNQALNNYQYDEIGNLTKDVKEGITSIKWSVYGKILEINRASTAANPVQKITYTYDAQGNRISKAVLKNTGTTSYTWYARDAQGNVMATYSSSGGASDLSQLPLSLSEQHIYGSSRLGMYAKLLNVDNGPKDMADSNSIKYYRGYRQYELGNHLGNVLATISDKKKGVDTDSDGIIDYYDADVTTAQDYYPFGMLMPGRIGYQSQGGWVSEPGSSTPGDNGLPSEISIDNRTNNLPPGYTATSSVELSPGFESGSGDAFLAYISEDDGSGGSGGEGSSLNGAYRYGFNGKENDNEVRGIGNSLDFGERNIYDTRLGRFISVDPNYRNLPDSSPYQYSRNSPLMFMENGQDGIVPRWLWRSGVLDPMAAGFIDAFADDVKGVWNVGKTTMAFSPGTFYYWTPSASQIRKEAIQTTKTIVTVMSNPVLRAVVLSNVYDDALNTAKNADAKDWQYATGYATWNVLSFFVG